MHCSFMNGKIVKVTWSKKLNLSIYKYFFFILQKDINPKGLYVFYQNGSDSNTNFFQLAQFPLELEEKVSM